MHIEIANKKYLNPKVKIGLLLFAGILIVAALAIIPRLYSYLDLLFQSIAVLLSVIVTAIVTNALLTGQSEKELDQQKSGMVFERKLTIYQEFLAKLCDVIKDDVITKEEAVELEFQTSFIAMHMEKSAQIENVIKDVNEIIGQVGASSTEEDKNKYKYAKSLFKIVSEFKEDLYHSTFAPDDKHIQEAVATFDEIVEGQVENVQIESGDDTEIFTDSATKNIDMVIKQICEQVGGEWRGEVLYNNPIGLVLHKGDRSALVFYLCCDPQYYFQIHIDVLERDYISVYQSFKSKFGGRRNKWCWWQYLPEEYRERKGFLQLLSNGDNKFIQYLVEQIVARIKYLDEFCELYFTVDIPLTGNDGSYRGWILTPAFEYRCIAFDRDDYDKTCFDVRLEENGSYSILIFNRTENDGALKSLTGRLGEDDENRYGVLDGTKKFIYKEGVDKYSILTEVKALIEEIEKLA